MIASPRAAAVRGAASRWVSGTGLPGLTSLASTGLFYASSGSTSSTTCNETRVPTESPTVDASILGDLLASSSTTEAGADTPAPSTTRRY